MVQDEYPTLVRIAPECEAPARLEEEDELEPQLWLWIAAGLVVGKLVWWWFKARWDRDVE